MIATASTRWAAHLCSVLRSLASALAQTREDPAQLVVVVQDGSVGGLGEPVAMLLHRSNLRGKLAALRDLAAGRPDLRQVLEAIDRPRTGLLLVLGHFEGTEATALYGYALGGPINLVEVLAPRLLKPPGQVGPLAPPPPARTPDGRGVVHARGSGDGPR